jgi:hypothetical protein
LNSFYSFYKNPHNNFTALLFENMTDTALITEPDVYSPSISEEDGRYIDVVPSFSDRLQGMKCSCTGRVFNTRQSFIVHTKTAVHKRWLETHNANRINYLQELEQARQLIHQQRIIIAQLEREKNDLRRTIHILSVPIVQAEPSRDLLDFD